MSATVIGALRQFLPAFLDTAPPLSPDQRRAIWALTHCRTPALGGRAFACDNQDCGHVHFAWHSCNHKACPQCGRQATSDWVQRETAKRVDAPYYLVTFTLPAQLRDCFFGPLAKQAYNLFFAAASGALTEKLAAPKGLGAHLSGFTAVLHTWNQRLLVHPHIHCLVPGAGLDAQGQLLRLQNPNFLVFLPHLRAAFRQHLRCLLTQHQWPVDPKVWTFEWGVQIQPVGSGATAIKYLGTYVARTAIADSRILALDDHTVTFRWTDRSDHNQVKTMILPGVEFVTRYLRHVLPQGLRSVRYYGFCHPAAKANRLRLQLQCGQPVDLGASPAQAPSSALAKPFPTCPRCGGPNRWIGNWPPLRSPTSSARAPPALPVAAQLPPPTA